MECDIEAVITLRHGPLLSSRVTSSNPAAHTPRPPRPGLDKEKNNSSTKNTTQRCALSPSTETESVRVRGCGQESRVHSVLARRD